MDDLILLFVASGGIEFFRVDAFFMCLAFISYVVRVFAYKKLLNTYFGLIPVFGDIVCMRRIGLKFNNSYTSRYTIFGVLSKISLSFFTIVIRLLIGFLAVYFFMGIISFFKPSEDVQNHSYSNLSLEQINIIIFVLFIFIIISIVSIGLNIYYRNKIIKPLIQLNVDVKKQGSIIFWSTLIPLVFYIWILRAKSLIKLDEMIE